MKEPSDSMTVPSCPACGKAMRLRTNRNDGSRFWGCSSYPNCKETLDAKGDFPDSDGDDASVGAASSPQVSVRWEDATLDRPGWECRYTTAGGRLRSSPSLADLSREFRQCWIARTQGQEIPIVPRDTQDTRRMVTALVRKIIQRGSNPPIHPEAERELLVSLGLKENIRESHLPGDISVRLEPDVFQNLSDRGQTLPSPDFEFSNDVRLGSDHERRFLRHWVPQNLGPKAPRWFIPQASLDALTASLGRDMPSGRRVDFLVSAPFGTPFVVEIDGKQHQTSVSPDRERDQLLKNVEIEVVRIPTAEIDHGHGENLERVRSLWTDPPGNPDRRALVASIMPPTIHRLVIALLDAVEAGFLKGHSWVVDVDCHPEVSPTMLWPYLRLFWAMDRLWGRASTMPQEVFVKTGTGWARFDAASKPVRSGPPDAAPQVMIRLQPELTAVDSLSPPDDSTPEIVVRSAHLPVVVGDDLYEPNIQFPLVQVDPEDIESALTEVLQGVFAKREFRDGQLQAVQEVMEGRDCVVLLPTGEGKSLIYQMAGLCKPGRTIVIDPLIALIEDQKRGLFGHGIDKVVGISSLDVTQGRYRDLLKQVESGDALFILVAPERFQKKAFRESISSLAHTTPINLAVIDEAHCISEWGHQFRTSYLTLGRTLRDVCKGSRDSSPPLLALTGTAPRSVLRDVLAQLSISTDSENAVVRPSSFDRPELGMNSLKCRPDDARAVLSGTLRSLPLEFGVSSAEFFRARADRTFSGLIFCPHVDGDYGILEVQRASSAVVGFRPAIYSGRPPRAMQGGRSDWNLQRQKLAERFKTNQIPLMVSTKAFGMGIDKPNIRYVLHYGMPGAIEAYYQEIGRAGRNRQRAHCLLIWNEQDRRRSDRLTLLGRGLESVRSEIESIGRVGRDSITQQLYLLLANFKGIDIEVEEINRIVTDGEFMPHLGERKTVQLAKGTGREEERRERALYRLMLLGVVEDYLVDAAFEVRLASISPSGVVEALSEFVDRTAPGSQRPSVAEIAARADSMDIREAVGKSARELVTFIYETIVESRRRSLREMYVAVRDSPPGGDGLRERVLDYLTRGDISPVLEGLVERTAFDYQSWERELAKFRGKDDANQLRGSAARLLTSYPSNPGLLFARAYAELIHPEGNLRDFEGHLERSLDSARQEYGVSADELDQFTDRLLKFLEESSHVGLSMAVDMADRLGMAKDTISEMKARALATPGYDSGVRILALTSWMGLLAEDLESAIAGMTDGR